MAASFIDLSGRVSIVAGGSGGIGAGTALELARAGSDEAIFDLMGDQASATAADVARQTGVKAQGYAVDVKAAKHGVVAVLIDLVKDQGPALVRSYGGGISEEEALRRAFLQVMPTQRLHRSLGSRTALHVAVQ